jgi:hypothetical protein
MNESDRPVNPTAAETTAEMAAIALEAVPAVGGVLAGIATAIISKRQNKRLNEFLMALAGDLRELRDRVNTSFTQTDSFQNLAEDVFSKVAETRQLEKIEALRAIFLNTILSDRPDYNEASEIADLINRWQARHVILLRILADPLSADRQMSGVVGRGGGISTSINQILSRLLPQWDDDQLDRTWKDLYDDQIHRTPGTKVMMTDRGIHQLENRLTDFGKKVARYISTPL